MTLPPLFLFPKMFSRTFDRRKALRERDFLKRFLLSYERAIRAERSLFQAISYLGLISLLLCALNEICFST